jgi:hypothetical protein
MHRALHFSLIQNAIKKSLISYFNRFSTARSPNLVVTHSPDHERSYVSERYLHTEDEQPTRVKTLWRTLQQMLVEPTIRVPLEGASPTFHL